MSATGRIETTAMRRPGIRRRALSAVPSPKSLWNAPSTWTMATRPVDFWKVSATDSPMVSSFTHCAK